MQRFDFCINLLPILPVPFAVIDGIKHQQQTDHQTRYNSGKEQVTDRSAGSHTVHDERNTRGNDNAKAAGNCHNRCGECQIITKSSQNRNCHASDSSNGRRSGTGNRTIKKAGDDNSARHTCGEFSEKIGKDIKQFFGDASLSHDDTGEDEHRNCQQGEGIETSEHGTDQIFGSYRKGRVKHRRKHRCDSKGNRYRNSDDQQCNKNQK